MFFAAADVRRRGIRSMVTRPAKQAVMSNKRRYAMMLFEAATAFLLALIVSLIFAYGFRRRGLWPGYLLFFLIVFLFTWAGGVWVTPFGPKFAGVQWLPFLIVALIIAFLIAAAIPPSYSRPRTSESEDLRRARTREVSRFLGIFFWILVVILLAALIARYV